MGHWIQGQGDIILGDNVLFDGKTSIIVRIPVRRAAHVARGQQHHRGHGAAITVGKLVTIGNHCMIAGGRHRGQQRSPIDPERRLARQPPSDDEVRPVVIEDNAGSEEARRSCPA